ncbi:MAG: hypothetical protein WA459_11980, partial [Stellaceae bacterium]
SGPRRSPDSQRQSGYALLPSRIRRQFLIQIDARLSPCLPRRRQRAVSLYLAPLGLDEHSFIHNQKTMLPQIVVDITNELRTHTLEVEALVVGCNGNLGYIFQIDGEGILTHHHDINFAAIGMGSGHAKSYLMFSKYQKLTTYFRAIPILYRAKKQAEIAPGVGSESDYYFINKNVGVQPVPKELIEVIAAHYEEEERRRENDIAIIEGKLNDAMTAMFSQLNLPSSTSPASSGAASSEDPSQTGQLPPQAAQPAEKPVETPPRSQRRRSGRRNR